MSTLSPKLLATQIAELRRGAAPEEHRRPVAVRHTGPWTGPATLIVEGTVCPVVQADSVLGVRAALAEAGETPFVLLTSLDRTTLGRDVVARLFRRKLYSVDPWTLLLGRFQATALDPRLKDEAVAHALIEASPPSGFTPPAGGLLDEDTAYRALARHRLRLDLAARGGGDVALVAWLIEANTPGRFESEVPQVRAAVRDWLVRTVDGGAPRLAAAGLALLEAKQNVGAWLLLLDATRGAPAAVVGAVSALFQHVTGGHPVDDTTLRRLDDTLRALAGQDGDVFAGHAEVLDRTFSTQIDALSLSRYGLVGLRARQESLAKALEGTTAAWGAVESLRGHQQAAEGQREAALALARLHAWLNAATRPATTLEGMALAYVTSGCWVDRARTAAEAFDFPGPVHARVEAFLARCTARREEENLKFAQALADWTAGHAPGAKKPLPGLCLIEDVLERVVAPVAEKAPVLVLLLDGMPLAIAHGLLDAIGGRDFHLVSTLKGDLRAVVSTVPTRTEWARTSLFAGEQTPGNLGVEKRTFAEHKGLRATCSAQKPPTLFHYADLNDRPQVEAAVADAATRVVGVVINAVDDDLSGSAQVLRDWRPETIRGLTALLQAARDAGRVVILTSDHGHVPHRKNMVTRKNETSIGGERWSPARPIDPGEVLFRGPRVAAFVNGGEAVVPGIEGLRYKVGKASAGYHGGATPQEVLAPLFVLWPSRNAEQMPPSLDRTPPAFWHPAGPGPVRGATPPPPPVPSVVASNAGTERPGSAIAEKAKLSDLPLFAAAAVSSPPLAAASASWSAALRSSPLYVERVARRGAGVRLTDAHINTLIDALAEAGGRLSLGNLSRRMEMGEMRVRGLAFGLKPVLNVDGYAVLAIDDVEGAVVLDLRALRVQFELGES